MRIRLQAFILSAAVFAVTASPAAAQRDGFVIGVGLGVGVNSFTSSFEGVSASSERENKTGVSTDLRLGGQLNPNLLLYYRNTVVFHGDELVDLVASGISGIGATYMPDDSPLHFMALVGIAAFTAISDGESDGETGFGASAGVGYEFSDRWIVDAGVVVGRPGDDGLTINMTQFKVGINFLSH